MTNSELLDALIAAVETIEWMNDCSSPAAMADHYGVTVGECTALINAGRALFDARAAK